MTPTPRPRRPRSPPPPRAPTTQVTFRIPDDWLDRADALAPALAPPGAVFGRTDVFRAAMFLGFERLQLGDYHSEAPTWSGIARDLERLDEPIPSKPPRPPRR